MPKRKKSKKSKNKYIPDVISYYANSNKNVTFDVTSKPKDIHLAAEQIFGTSRYIDLDTLIKNDII